jgi:trans-aconitate 2-methyltransferase
VTQNRPREWNATAYDALPLPHERWGARTLDRLQLTGDEIVMDAGCGTGRDAARLLGRFPGCRVVAVDGSAKMLDRLRERLGEQLPRVDVIQADLQKPLPITSPVDAIMSVAAFHWIPDHDALFGNLATVLRPGGRMATDCGGQGNIAIINAAVDTVLGRPAGDWEFAGIEDTRRRLAASGFTDLDVRLVPDPIRLRNPDELHAYLRTVMLGGELDRMPEVEHEPFVAAIAGQLPEPVIDYVRLEITAIRG